MRAVTWQGRRDVRVETVPDPTIEQATDAIVQVTSTAICGSDLHLYEVLGPFMSPGDVLGHEPMGTVVEVGAEAADHLRVGDRVVVPFNIACGRCAMCGQGLQSQCETTQVRAHGTGAALFGYSKLYGQVPGGQAEYLRVPHADYGPIKVPPGTPDDRYLFLSDVLPTAWQAVQYAALPAGGTLVVLGLGPIGAMAGRIALVNGARRVIGVDLVPDRLERARSLGMDTVEYGDGSGVVEMIREETDGRGPDAVIDAVGMEAHGSPLGRAAQRMAGFLPDAAARALMQKAGTDRLAALNLAIEVVRRGGTISIVGVYGGMTDPLPMMQLFDKQVQLRMGQANVRRWVDQLLPLLDAPEDPLGVDRFASHHLALDEAPGAYERFQKKQDGTFKVVLQP